MTKLFNKYKTKIDFYGLEFNKKIKLNAQYHSQDYIISILTFLLNTNRESYLKRLHKDVYTQTNLIKQLSLCHKNISKLNTLYFLMIMY